MTETSLNGGRANLIKTLFVMVAVFYLFIAPAFADEVYKLTLQDGPLMIRKDSTVTKKIIGIPRTNGGSLSLKIKWHALSFIPNTYAKLKIEILHGSRVLETNNCYSVHAPGSKTPQCLISKRLELAEVTAPGDFKLRITNDSNDDVGGFNILKEFTDVQVGDWVESTFRIMCNIEGASLNKGGLGGIDIGKNSTVEVAVFIPVPNQHRAGQLHLKAKWHGGFSINPTVSSFHRLRVEVLLDGEVIKSDEGFSIHSTEKGRTNKLDMIIDLPYRNYDNGLLKLRIINEGPDPITGFNIQKGWDLNPTVPDFKSLFNPCI